MNTMIRWLLVAAVLGFVGAMLFPKTAHGQTPCPATPACEPYTTLDRTQCGPELKGRTATGEWRGWWYATGPGKWCPFTWVSLDKVAPKTLADTLRVVDTIKAASSPTQGIMAAISAFGVKPAPGSQDEIDLELLRYTACQALVASPPSPQGWTAPGPKCVIKVFPPPVVTHRVKPNVSAADGSRPVYRLNADGTLGGAIAGVRAAANTPCDVTLPTRPSGADVYATPQGRAAREVSLCRTATP